MRLLHLQTSGIEKEMDQLKGLLRNQHFLLMFVRTLEKQPTFNVNEKYSMFTYVFYMKCHIMNELQNYKCSNFRFEKHTNVWENPVEEVKFY